MPVIDIKIKNKIAVCQKRYLISANSNYSVCFNFDEEWDDGIKTARIFFDDSYTDVLFSGNTVTIPKIPSCKSLGIGVYTSTLSSTVADIGCITSAADTDCKDIYEVTTSQYDQIMNMLNQAELRQIESITRENSIVTVKYNNGTSDSFELKDAVGVESGKVDDDGDLSLTLSDGKVLQCGNLGIKKSWSLLTSITLTETVDELIINQSDDGKSFCVKELFIKVTSKRCSETTKNTNLLCQESRVPKNLLSPQVIFKNVLRSDADAGGGCYMKATAYGNCLSVTGPASLGGYSNVASSDVFVNNVQDIAGLVFYPAATTGRIGAGTVIKIYARR